MQEKHNIGLLMAQPDLDDSHRYAIGIKIAGMGCVPLKSYSELEALKTGFTEFYRFATQSEIARPIAVERQSSGVPWDKCPCCTLPDLMNEVLGELRAEELKRSVEAGAKR